MRETLFISDLHLDRARSTATRAFLTFLETSAARAEALYILGDLFEAWVGDDDNSPGHHRILMGLSHLPEVGIRGYLLRGNRDFLLGRRFEEMTGWTILGDPAVIDLYGERTLLMHGDLLCTDDVDYQKFRTRVRDAHWQQKFLSKPLFLRRLLAWYARRGSRQQTRKKPTAIMDVNQQTVERTMREQGVRRLIHGHTHRPAIHEFMLDGALAKRIVLGDWYMQGSVLHLSASGCRLQSICYAT
jgi:UDP-2,3-diacylglucosamine hydrolase